MSDAAVERNYEVETGNQILDCFENRDPLHTPMVLVAGHGPFTWGATPEKAVYNAAVLEELARMAFVTRTLDPEAVTSAGDAWSASTSSESTARTPTTARNERPDLIQGGPRRPRHRVRLDAHQGVADRAGHHAARRRVRTLGTTS